MLKSSVATGECLGIQGWHRPIDIKGVVLVDVAKKVDICSHLHTVQLSLKQKVVYILYHSTIVFVPSQIRWYVCEQGYLVMSKENEYLIPREALFFMNFANSFEFWVADGQPHCPMSLERRLARCFDS